MSSSLKVSELGTVQKCFAETRLNENCFLKGCKWSPDGLCILTSSDDNCLRLFELTGPQDEIPRVSERPVLQYNDGGTIYDFSWLPSMDSSDPNSCVFASTSRDSPVHLWDAYDGYLRATYQVINQFDEVASAYSLCFTTQNKLFAGLKNELRVFDVSIPGRESEKRSLKFRDTPSFQTGIVSAISFRPNTCDIYAVGTYDRTIGIYTEPDGELQYVLMGHRGGVTHLSFSPDGTRLFSGARRDPTIFCWDLRNPGSILFTMNRKVETCQRIYFDISADGRYLFTGSTDGYVHIFDTTASVPETRCLDPISSFLAHADCANGASLRPQGQLLATSSGQRHYPRSHLESDDDDSDGDDGDGGKIENSLKIWRLTS